MCFKFFAKFKFKRAFLVPWKQATACHIIPDFPLQLTDGLHSLAEDGSSPGLQRKKLLFASSKKEEVLWAASQQPGHSRTSQAMGEAGVPGEGQPRDHHSPSWTGDAAVTCSLQRPYTPRQLMQGPNAPKNMHFLPDSLIRSLFVRFGPSLHRSSKSLTQGPLDQPLTFPWSLFGEPARSYLLTPRCNTAPFFHMHR